MGVTDDPTDPRLTHGVDTEPRSQAEMYLVLSEAERAKGWVRPLRFSYTHVGPAGPTYPIRDLTPEERERFGGDTGYVKYEEYRHRVAEASALGRFWTQAQLDAVQGGCLTSTRMNGALAETYAREPSFYGGTYCVGCAKHLPVAEFVWDDEPFLGDKAARVGS